MRFKAGKRSPRLEGLSTEKLSDSFRGALTLRKSPKYALNNSLHAFDSASPKEETFRVQAELSRNVGLLYQSMIPPR